MKLAEQVLNTLKEGLSKEEEKEFIQGSRGFPKEFMKLAKKGKQLFVHKHGNLDTVLDGGDLLARAKVESWLGRDSVVVAKVSSKNANIPEGHIFLGVVGMKKAVVNAFVEKIDGDTLYISSMSGDLLK